MVRTVCSGIFSSFSVGVESFFGVVAGKYDMIRRFMYIPKTPTKGRFVKATP